MRNVYTIIKIIFVIFLGLILVSCNKIQTGKNVILTTIYPYELIVKQLVKDKFTVESLIPGNASPHNYSPLPSDIERIDKAVLVVSNGMDLEEQFEKVFSNIRKKHIMASTFTSKDYFLVDLRKEMHSNDNHNHQHESAQDVSEHHHEVNPHIWLHTEMIIDIAKGLTDKLIKISPENESFIRKNLEELINDIQKTDQKIINERGQLKHCGSLVMHDSFFYFNQRYNIESYGHIQKFPGKEPTPKELENIAKLIKQNNIMTIFIEPQLNPKPAQILSNEFSLKVMTLDPLGVSYNVNSISELLIKNWEIIRDGNK